MSPQAYRLQLADCFHREKEAFTWVHGDGSTTYTTTMSERHAARYNRENPTSAPLPTSPVSFNQGKFFTADTFGEDPSAEDKEKIYNIDVANIDALNEKLCPPDMPEDDQETFIETVVDVTALPGLFRSTDTSNEMTTASETVPSEVGTMIGMKASITDVIRRAPSKTALGRIKSQEQLHHTIRKAEKSGKVAFA